MAARYHDYSVFYVIVLVCVFTIAFVILLWKPSKTTTIGTGYRVQDSRYHDSPSSLPYSYDNLEYILALDHFYEFKEGFRNPQPQRQFTESPYDAFHGLSSLCPTASKHNSSIVRACNNNKSKSHDQSITTKSCCKTVLFVGMCGFWKDKIRTFPFKLTCPVQRCKKNSKSKCSCTVVTDHVDTPEAIRNGDLVIFTHIPNYMSNSLWRDLHSHKHNRQRWVFSTIESPIYVRGLLPPWRLRNETYEFADTFYSDADVSTPYGYYQPFRIGEWRQESWNVSEHVGVKNKLIAWTASHCETLQWDRINFVRDLEAILQVDTYGKCGNKPVCKDYWNDSCSKEFEDLMKTYKFVLSLENSCCREYITEKFWKMLDLGTVPVVIGPPLQDVERQAPPGSFIHADQFTSMWDLADYLRYLDQNKTAYMEYFSWKRKGRVYVDTAPEHYKRAVSDRTLCTLINLLLKETESGASDASKGRHSSRNVFDAYSSSWLERCETCGRHDWLKKYEFPPEHQRKSESLWM